MDKYKYAKIAFETHRNKTKEEYPDIDISHYKWDKLNDSIKEVWFVTTEAVIEVNNVLASNDDKLKQEISQYQSEPWWVTKLDKKESNKEFYLKMSASASDLLHHDLPWHKAVFVETFRTKQKNKELAKLDRKSTRLNSSHLKLSRMPSSA